MGVPNNCAAILRCVVGSMSGTFESKEPLGLVSERVCNPQACPRLDENECLVCLPFLAPSHVAATQHTSC